MNPDIEKAIQVIDNQIKELEHAKRTLISSFGGIGLRATAASSSVGAEGINRVRLNRETPEPRLSRKATIVKLLTEKGPLSKKEIHALTDMPRGSVSFSLNDKEKFYSQDGKWHLVADQANPSPAEQQ